MKLRVYVNDMCLDIAVKDNTVTQEELIEGLDECGVIALLTKEGNTIIINSNNVTAIEIINESPLLKK